MTAKRSAPGRMAAPPPKRQCPAEFQATMLALASGAFAVHEARTLLGAGAGISRVRLLVKPTRAVPPKSDAPHRPHLDLADVLAKLASVLDRPRSARSLEEEFGVDLGVATEAEYTEILNGGGSGGGGLQRLGGHAQEQRFQRTRHECPGVVTAAHGARV